MRWTVLSSDALIFFPAVLYFINVYYSGKPIKEKTSVAWHIALILLNPCLILIDHGHFQVGVSPTWFVAWNFYFGGCSNTSNIALMLVFAFLQYNCISLGLTVAAVAAILSDRDVVGSVLFSLALNHKQVLFFCSRDF